MGNPFKKISKEVSRVGRRVGREIQRSTGDILRSEIGSIATLGLGGEIADQIDPLDPDIINITPAPEAPDLQSEEVKAAILRERQRARRGRRGNILSDSTGSGVSTGGQAQATLLG
jgi:hypothetical protein